MESNDVIGDRPIESSWGVCTAMYKGGGVTKEPNAHSERQNQEHLHVRREAPERTLRGMDETKNCVSGEVNTPTIKCGPLVRACAGRDRDLEERVGRGYDQIASTRRREGERCLWVVLLTGYKDEP